MVVAHCAMTMSFESLFPALATDQLGMEPGAGTLAGFGFLMVAYGAPAMVTSLALAGVRGEGTRGRLYLWLGVLSGLSPVALALSPNLALVILSVAVMGASQSGFMTLSGGMVQSLAPRRHPGSPHERSWLAHSRVHGQFQFGQWHPGGHYGAVCRFDSRGRRDTLRHSDGRKFRQGPAAAGIRRGGDDGGGIGASAGYQ